MATNYAQAFGIRNHWAPIVFAVFYFFVFLYYLFRSIRNQGSANVYRGLALFALIRITAFALRTAMAFSQHAANSRNIGIAYAILYNVGFFSLLLSAYNLIHNRERLAKLNERASRITSHFHKGRVVHILLTIAVILGVVGATLALRGPSYGTGTGLYRAMEYIFLAVAAIITVLTLMLIMLERRVSRTDSTAGSPIGAKHHWLILLTIALLLLARTLYFAVTARHRMLGKQHNEHLWYPLAALTEALVPLLILTPGLVPLAVHYLARDHREKSALGPNGHNGADGAYANGNNGVYANNNNHAGVVGSGAHGGHNAGFRGGDNVV